MNGKRLRLNADAKNGSLRVAVVSPDNSEAPGYSAADCESVQEDKTSIIVQWNGREEINAGEEESMRLKIIMKNCRLYSFEVV